MPANVCRKNCPWPNQCGWAIQIAGVALGPFAPTPERTTTATLPIIVPVARGTSALVPANGPGAKMCRTFITTVACTTTPAGVLLFLRGSWRPPMYWPNTATKAPPTRCTPIPFRATNTFSPVAVRIGCHRSRLNYGRGPVLKPCTAHGPTMPMVGTNTKHWPMSIKTRQWWGMSCC